MGVDWWIADAVKDVAASSCQKLNLKTAELRAEVTQLMVTVARTPENIEIMRSLIRRCEEVDRECVEWGNNVPEAWRYKTVAWEDNVPGGDYTKAEVFPGRVDAYTDFWIAAVWNMIRVSRLSLASIMVRCAAWVCSPVDYRTTPEYAAAARTCVDTITDIIASVPYHLGWQNKRVNLREGSPRVAGFMTGEEEAPKGLAGYFLTYPLALVNSQDYATDAQRLWVTGRFKVIADVLGIKYAHLLSQVCINHTHLTRYLFHHFQEPHS